MLDHAYKLGAARAFEKLGVRFSASTFAHELGHALNHKDSRKGRIDNPAETALRAIPDIAGGAGVLAGMLARKPWLAAGLFGASRVPKLLSEGTASQLGLDKLRSWNTTEEEMEAAERALDMALGTYGANAVGGTVAAGGTAAMFKRMFPNKFSEVWSGAKPLPARFPWRRILPAAALMGAGMLASNTIGGLLRKGVDDAPTPDISGDEAEDRVRESGLGTALVRTLGRSNFFVPPQSLNGMLGVPRSADYTGAIALQDKDAFWA